MVLSVVILSILSEEKYLVVAIGCSVNLVVFRLYSFSERRFWAYSMKILLIEKLTSFTLVYSFLMRFSCRKIYYFSEAQLFKKESFLKKLEKLSICRVKMSEVNAKGLYCTIQKDVFDLVEILFEKKFYKQTVTKI